MENNDNKKSSKRRRNTIIAICIIIIIIILLLHSCGKKDGSFEPDLDSDAIDWSGEIDTGAKETEISTETIAIPGYPYIYIGAGETTAHISLLNPEGNPCYFVFEIVLTDTQEVLYTSKMVPPGQAVAQEEFSRALTAGQYDAVIKISTYSLTDGSEMNGANMVTLLTVQ